MPMRLWSLVRSHDATVCSWLRYVTRGAASVIVVSMVLPVLLRGAGCAGSAGASPRDRGCRTRSDFTYSMSAITLSSLTRPWKVGISGW